MKNKQLKFIKIMIERNIYIIIKNKYCKIKASIIKDDAEFTKSYKKCMGSNEGNSGIISLPF